MHESLVKKQEKTSQINHCSTKKKIQIHLDKSRPNQYFKNASLIQRKPTCACNGGCPSCANESIIQTKLKISNPNNECEKEADAISEKIINRAIFQSPKSCSKEEEEKLKVLLHPKQTNNYTPSINSHLETKISTLENGGQSLPLQIQQFYNSIMNYDFSNVMIHTDSRAAEIADHLKARAFTKGNHIVFGSGGYKPSTVRGKRLLSHELVHVKQQNVSNDLSTVQKIFKKPCNTKDGPFKPEGEKNKYIQFNVNPGIGGIEAFRSGETGHVAIQLGDPESNESYSYGLGYPSNVDLIDFITKPSSEGVAGIVHHPDKEKNRKFKDDNLSEDQYNIALTDAKKKCKNSPNYHPINNNCYDFVIGIAKTAKIPNIPKYTETLKFFRREKGITYHSPYALFRGKNIEHVISKDQKENLFT